MKLMKRKTLDSPDGKQQIETLVWEAALILQHVTGGTSWPVSSVSSPQLARCPPCGLRTFNL